MSRLKQAIFEHATQVLGFEDCRFTSPFLTQELDEYRDWVAQDKMGDMGYLVRHLPFKEDPNLLLPGVKTAIVVIKNYKNTPESFLTGDRKVSRYAVGRDYHGVIMDALIGLEAFILSQEPRAQCYMGIDSRPIAERSLALKSGIGFRGKNTMVIKPKLGSYFFIGVLLTTVAFDSDLPFKGTCGTCRRCIEACPTGALSEEGQMDAQACIAYRTIERKTPPTPEERTQFQGWVFGCDICQEVCPFNHPNTPLSNWEAWLPSAGVGFQLDPALIPDQIPKDTVLYRSRKRLLCNSLE